MAHSLSMGMAGLFTGLAFLARGEGALLLPMLIVFLPAGQRLRGAAWLLAGFTLPLLVWSLYAWPTFGAILPHTLSVKLAQGRVAPWAERFPAGLWRDMADTWGRHLWASAPGLRWAFWPLALAGIALLLRAHAWRVFAGWILLHGLAYSAMGLPAYCYWYRFPEYWLWLSGLAAGAAAWMHWRPAPKMLRLASQAVAGVLITLLVAGPILVETAVARARVEDPRARPYREIAAWLREHAQPGDTVAATEVGYLGYYTAQPILDLAGITTPEVLPLVRPGDANLDVVDRFQPEYWVNYWGVAQQEAPKALRTAHCVYELVLAPRGANGRGETTTYPLYRRTHAAAPGGTTPP